MNEIFDNLSKVSNKDGTCLKAKTETAINSTTQNKSPPPKKRMFNDNDYTEMIKEMMVFEEDGNFDGFTHIGDEANNDDDEDVVELEQSFAMNYWHNSVENMRLEEEDEINKVLDERVLSSGEQVS